MMTIEELRAVLGWCAVINYVLLLLWFFLFTGAHSWFYGMHKRWFNLMTVEKFDAFHYQMIGFFKIAWFIFNVVPYIALRIVF